MKHHITSLLLLIVFSFSCSSEKSANLETKLDPIADSLFNVSMERFFNTQFAFEKDTSAILLSISEIQQAIQIEPNYTDLYGAIANMYIRIGEFDQAQAELEKVIEISPDFSEAYSGIGFLLEYQGRRDEAIEWYKKAINADNERIQKGKLVFYSKINSAFLLFFVENDQAAHNRLEEIKEEYPDHEDVEFYEILFSDFKKEEFLESIHE